MNRRPGLFLNIIAGLLLLVTAGISRADDSYFSFSFNYSNYGHYVHPYRYVYAPSYIYAVPSPFFFGYTSYYYPVFPYYYSPVVYYRPYLPYYYPYAYSPYRSFHVHYSAYRSIYPSTYVYGYYPYNRYYSYHPYKYYHYQPGYYHDHFHGHGKSHHKGNNNKQTVINKQVVKQNITNNNNNQNIIITNATIEEQRKREIDKYRSSLQKNVQDNKPVSSINKFYGRKPDIQNDRLSVQQDNVKRLQMHRDNDDSFGKNTVSSTEKSNLERIDRLINQKPELSMNNDRRFQANEKVIHYQQYRTQENAGNNTARISADQARQNYLKNPVPAGNKFTSRSTAIRQPAVSYNKEPVTQRQDRYRNNNNDRISLPQKQEIVTNNFPDNSASSWVTGRGQEGPGENNRVRNSERGPGERGPGERGPGERGPGERGKIGGRNTEQNISFGRMRFESRSSMGFRR